MGIFRQLILLFSIVTLMSACEEDFLVETRDFKPKLVINSIFKPGEKWMVNVTSSRDFLVPGSNIRTIENAYVTIIEKSTGRETILKHTESGNYTSDIYPPEINKTYEIIVIADGFEPVSSSSKAPKKANIVNIISDVVDNNNTKVNFEVRDDINNYLIWNFISSNKNNPLDTTFSGNPKSLVSSIVKYNNINSYLGGLTVAENNGVVQEGKFSGTVKTLQSSAIDTTISNPDANVESKKYLRMLTTSVDLFNYYKSVEKFISSENHNSSFSYSPQIHSNIKNGLGIFAGYTEEYKEIK